MWIWQRCGWLFVAGFAGNIVGSSFGSGLVCLVPEHMGWPGNAVQRRAKKGIFHVVADLENIRGREAGKRRFRLNWKHFDLKKNISLKYSGFRSLQNGQFDKKCKVCVLQIDQLIPF